MIIKLTDRNLSDIDIYTGTNERQLRHYYEPHGGLFIAESPMIIHRALDAGCRPLSVLAEDRFLNRDDGILARMRDQIPVYTAPHDVLIGLTGYQLTRGFLCAMHRPEERTAGDICRDLAAGSERSRIAVLSDVENPTNIGAIFRSAAALGIDAVLLTRDSGDPLQRRTLRAGMGAQLAVPWGYLDQIKDGDSLIGQLHALGYRSSALALTDASMSLQDERLRTTDRLAILVGNEAYGLSREVIAESDYVVTIPMHHGVDSLNAAVAAGIVFYALASHDIPASSSVFLSNK